MLIYGVFLIQKKNKILIIGASGTLGKAIKKNNFFKKASIPSKKKLNIIFTKNIKKYLNKKRFQIIINCAAISKVKQCEENPKIAKKVNILGVKKLVKCIEDCEKKINQRLFLFIYLLMQYIRRTGEIIKKIALSHLTMCMEKQN